MIRIAAGPEDFDSAALVVALEALGGGAVATFTGLVRGEGGLTGLQLDHYPAMTEKVLGVIAASAMERWPLKGITIVHRTGLLAPGARIVFVGTVSAHRAAALEACHFLIDWLKTEAPFWKKEHFADGGQCWIEARAEDDAAKDKWV
ncbi:molybdenum cofactor biosynthesis protein MoaE [Sphingobium boeckii]|uniref:Molybdopterin synthase catalytic subunit n=1 Tax=Sphingobium boeckii TaxID=1082345 RepID=A0A7W9EFB7_9SPHN|nr:molybdenum cofactor biosynthesis protein MoaE [Sphingobium boeckii]MBB5685551.1 molybdopterin synthase catalytic subunit [Sphingobium boeckii]